MTRNTENKKVVITAGGTGGHVFPAITIANHLIKNGYDVLFITDIRALSYFKDNADKKIIIKTCLSKSISGNIFKKLYATFITSLGCVQAFFIFINFFPKSVIAFGGYASFPASIISALFKRQLILHEQNAVLGKTNKILARFANIIALSFKNTANIPANKKTIFTGYPIRESINEFLNKKPTPSKHINILIMGGSQGAKLFNSLSYVFADLPKTLREEIFITQQIVDKFDANETEKLYNKTGIKHNIKPFFNDPFNQIHNANLVISRSGAGNCFETATLNKKAIFVPLKIATDNHQFLNAQNFTKYGDIIIEEKDLNFKTATDIILPLLQNRKLLKLDKPYIPETNVKEAFLTLIK